jgi:uncharacterized membrane protein (Fun14 family)
MRPLLKTLLLVLGIGALVLLTKGFPQLRAVLKVFLHPVGLIFLGVLGFWIYRVRTRRTRDQARIIDDVPKRIAPPRDNQEDDHA